MFSKAVVRLCYIILRLKFVCCLGVAAEKCLQNVLDNIAPGSIIVFHDSIKASKNLKFVLPRTLQYIKENGYSCAAITKAVLEQGQ